MKHVFKTVALACAILLLTVTTQPAQAAGVVGDGTPGSCTNAALAAALESEGTVTFNCGATDTTITITDTLKFEKWNIVVDGGGKITLQGTPGVRIIDFRTWGFDAARTVTLKNLKITGASITGDTDGANGAAIRVKNQSALFQQDVPTLVLDNVEFTNNMSTLTGIGDAFAYDFGGGAVYILGGILNVKNSTFTGNRVEGGAGGALHGLGSSIKITNSTFNGNIATRRNANDENSGFAGALYVDGARFGGGGSIKIKTSTFENNAAANQGGVAYINLYKSRGEGLKIDRSRFVNNSVSAGVLGWGGAISGGGTGGAVPVKITRSAFIGNTADGNRGGGDGGAVALPQAANVTIANSTFTGNTARVACSDNCFSGRGGAIYISGGDQPFQIINSTIANNHAEWFAGGIFGKDGMLKNTIVANNTADNRGSSPGSFSQCHETLQSAGSNVQFPESGKLCAGGIRVADPVLGSLSNDVLPLLPGSPAINRGDNAICAAPPVKGVDQRGVKRPQGSRCDIGAYESENAPAAPSKPDLTAPTNDSTGQSTTPTFTWNASSGATGYNVVIKKMSGKKVKKAKLTLDQANCASDTTCEYTLEGKTLRAGKKYQWFVKARSDGGAAKSSKWVFRVAP